VLKEPARPSTWRSVRSEIVLWAVVPACLLAAWMYAFPTATYSPDWQQGVYSWGVFNSWESLVVPLSIFAIGFGFRLRTLPMLRMWILLPTVGATAVWWIAFAAALKATVFCLVYMYDVIHVRLSIW
jgi:hypothetical protein